MKISNPGIYRDFPTDAYFADPCVEPSFTQSLAKILIEQSPLHAYQAHPRLNVRAPDDDASEAYNKAQAIGNAAHALLLDRGKELFVSDFDNWMKADAKKEKAAASPSATSSGPVLAVNATTASRAASWNGWTPTVSTTRCEARNTRRWLMPDPLKKTISATEAAALWNVSPWVTRWMLWQKFAKGVEIDSPADSRMTWGTKLQPLIVEQAAEDLKLRVIPNDSDAYVRRGNLGCTRDAVVICPDRGPGALETKCVFDYRTWMSDWEGGMRAPKHYEIQLQQQMLVGDEKPYQWGVLAVWVAGDVHYFEREPIFDLWDKLNDEALAFFNSVHANDEPDPFGATVEIEWLMKLLPTKAGKVIDLSGDARASEWSRIAESYVAAKEGENAGKRIAEPLRAKLLGLAKDAQKVILPGAIEVRIGGNEKSKRLSVYVPEISRSENILMAG